MTFHGPKGFVTFSMTNHIAGKQLIGSHLATVIAREQLAIAGTWARSRTSSPLRMQAGADCALIPVARASPMPVNCEWSFTDKYLLRSVALGPLRNEFSEHYGTEPLQAESSAHPPFPSLKDATQPHNRVSKARRNAAIASISINDTDQAYQHFILQCRT